MRGIKLTLAFICSEYKFADMKTVNKTRNSAFLLFVLTFLWACGQVGAKSGDKILNSNPSSGEFTIVFSTGNHGETDPCG
ncbi:MAG TPA: hypothetical protein DHU63_10420 [Candidatus Marinimicrobia bacterium]|nr:MAG: hypothetical protein AUJ47_02485 [Candidatus Marinimicrobia bacterium CG1_02_48_14]PIZ65468.1 MAG: hypothetical protein COY19_07905 [Candidatus Marinimicrobia bacterium CG_4_10_14_0_2_um_filter_48_9]PJA51923.1 MAG: hypothetical protein CO167_11375 [Candidatus Marinimicrobia bacterium CG_4_9_14_3_um_filter_48_9]HCW76935.1 hypothetical protein [Candidatus Neomarinimicrobiota bacterium]